jgi:hypothetical protein
MSTAPILSLTFVGKQVTIYCGILILAGGILGGLLNTIVFLSLQTFRQSSCAFYLTIMSFVNIGELLVGMLSQIMLALYNTDGTDTSPFYCKFRIYMSNVCAMISLTCFCLATIDQYCATSSRPRLQQLCNIKLAQCLISIFSFIWILHAIPYAALFNLTVSSVTGKGICLMTNSIYIQYRIYFILLILLGLLPLSITLLFGSMAYRNVQQLAFYTLPLVRRELDKQLTAMVLAQVVVNFFTILPYNISNILSLNSKSNTDPFFQAQIQLSSNMTVMLYYVYYAVSTNESDFIERKF